VTPLPPTAPPLLHPTEDAAAAPVPQPAHGGLAALFTTHILQDGEIVLLIRKPSLWFIPLQSLWFAGFAAAIAIGLTLAQGPLDLLRARLYFEAAGFLTLCRLMWVSLQWMGRLYVLTNLRILRLSGVLGTEIFDCPLRKVAHVRLVATIRERSVGIGSIWIFPADDTRAPALWQSIAKPRQIQSEIAAAINRAKQ
jgi:PH (Pleckstrin Homology) domain-containing protein